MFIIVNKNMDQNINLGKINRKNIEANFTGGTITSDDY